MSCVYDAVAQWVTAVYGGVACQVDVQVQSRKP